MEAKHTPGPWSITNTIMGSAETTVWPSAVVAAPYGSVDTVCDFSFMTNKPHGEQQANARLIAAAPELLAALRAMIERAEWHGDKDADGLCGARAAVAKAEGR